MGSAPPTLPSAKPISLSENVTLHLPLTRLGKGPGLLILLPRGYETHSKDSKATLDPEPLQKWAEEGFCVVQVRVDNTADGGTPSSIVEACTHGLNALQTYPECTLDAKFGMIVYDVDLDFDIEEALLKTCGFAITVSFTNSAGAICAVSGMKALVPSMIHASEKSDNETAEVVYTYNASSPSFVLPNHYHYQPGAAALAHTRTLTFLKKHLGFPIFDLEAIWDEHTLFEFGERDVTKTMGTMVDEPYVNHVPTMTGGVGRAALTAFYRDHFIFNNPEDTKLELISRTVGVDRVIDEFIFSLTHDKVIDWLVPGIPPTHKHVRIPFTSIVNIRGDRLYHEHIAWDQATVLRQLGLLPEWLPFPYPQADGRLPSKGKRFEFRVPTAGLEIAMKAVDERSVDSNGLMNAESIREVDDV